MTSKSLIDTKAIAENFIKELISSRLGDLKVGARNEGAIVVALSGDLGSGKTTFTKSCAAFLGVSSEQVTSPTFVIQKSFPITLDEARAAGFEKLIHIDAYRLEKADEIERLHWRDTIADSANLILIEWPENIGEALPKTAKRISFTTIDENTREIVFN